MNRSTPPDWRQNSDFNKMDTVSFTLGQVVYLKTKTEHGGMVTGILFRPNGHSYLVTWSHDFTERYHFEVELTAEKTFTTSDL